MDMKEYQKLAQRTAAAPIGAMCILGKEEKITKLVHAQLGIASELGELADAIKKYLYYGRDFDRVNVLEEFGDLLWYIAEGVEAMDSDMATVAGANIEKLKKRYPVAFSDKGAENRDTTGERTVLGHSFSKDAAFGNIWNEPQASYHAETTAQFDPHDKHYAEKAIEPILVIEQVMETANAIPAKNRLSIAQALRYLLRVGTKSGENWQKELEKAENYIHRARTGSWIGR